MNSPQASTGSTKKKKLLDNPLLSGIAVPIAIVLVGSLIVFGVTKMLSTSRSYKDLVSELHSKTFGNRWVAAYELSKVINSKSVPKEDVPWLIENLDQVYNEAIDPRTRNFTIVALGAIGHENVLPILKRALEDSDQKVKFHAVAALSNMPKGIKFDWSLVESLMKSDDLGLKQAVMLTLATHHVPSAEKILLSQIDSSEVSLRYAAATGLVYYKNEAAIPIIKEILLLKSYPEKAGLFNADKIHGLKANILSALGKNNWKRPGSIVEEMAQQEKNMKVLNQAKTWLKQLKN